MKTETELRELFEKANPVADDVYFQRGKYFSTFDECIEEEYNGKWQGFKQAAAYYEQLLEEANAHSIFLDKARS